MTYDRHSKNTNRSKLRRNLPLTCYFRARFSASRPLLKSPIFIKADRVARVWHSRLGSGAGGHLARRLRRFPALPGLPPASPIYIPQTGGFEITVLRFLKT